MKKVIITILSVIYTISGIAQFDKHFEDKTLRVDYLRKGCKKEQQISLKAFKTKPGTWAGSTTHLLDPFNYGAHRVLVKDANSKEEIYSHTYNSLFEEYIACLLYTSPSPRDS